MPHTLPLARRDDEFRPHRRPRPGRAPWRIVKPDSGYVTIVDADGNPLICALPEIAGRIIGAVNFVECAHPIARGRIDEQS